MPSVPDQTAPMSKAVDPREEALRSLDERAKALEARTAHDAPDYSGQAIGQGSRLVAGLIGGPLVGLAFGAGFDLLAHSAPWGLIVGILAGFAVSVFMAVKAAQKMSAAAAAEWGPPQALADDDDEDEEP